MAVRDGLLFFYNCGHIYLRMVFGIPTFHFFKLS